MRLSNQTKVLVTGACGFIGSHLVEELVKSGTSVRALVYYNRENSFGNLDELDPSILDQVEVLAGDINDPYFTRKAVKGCQVVFHLAALIGIPYSYLSPSSYIETNVKGSLNVFQACMDEKVDKVVHTSTSEVYGTARRTPIDEEHPLQGQSPYSASKIAADKLAESYHLAFGLPIATARPFNTFGPRQSGRAVIPTIICQLASGSDHLNLGSLAPARDLTYVTDMVRGFINIAQSDSTVGKVINLGTGHSITIGDLAKLIIRMMKRNVKIVCDEKRVRPEKSEVMNLVSDNQKAFKLAKWQPLVTLENGLTDTITYIEKHLERYKVEVYSV